MSTGSPSAYLLWALLSVFFFTFMLIHLWSYDRFKCLRWDSGRQPGAFKRVMTYSYFATVPLLMVFSVAISALKYQEGSFVFDGQIIPRPYAVWQESRLRWILPLYFILSIAWALELVTHLEELTFWLFLLHQGPRKREWFDSWEFRTWYLGSMVAVLGLPLTTLIKRDNIETCEAWIFLGGASAGTFTTVCFLYVLARFPGFIRSVKAEGAEPDVVVRLATFYNLNCIRIVFRFLFSIPLLTLALDALVDKKFSIIGSSFWSDLFLMMGAIGCFISSAITMLVFFPRSMTVEAGYKAHAPVHHSKSHASGVLPDYEHHDSPLPSPKSMTSIDRNPRPSAQMAAFHFSETPPDADGHYFPAPDPEIPPPPHQCKYDSQRTVALARPPSGTRSDDTLWDARNGSLKPTATASTSQLSRSGSGRGGAAPMFVNGTPIYVEEVPPALEPQYPLVHPYAMSFTSPIDLPEDTS
ncbi:hypothetical protein DFH07DRAFT_828234 [Mycena maculata]|uniref:Transmembrane protein n=1 Tax=Mycena maculata TaxID=230809 RepID=A0AAD7ITH9_9AGAR|nr:hypothetical protein DFH07DRAFT_828234 [Mycena maculata]